MDVATAKGDTKAYLQANRQFHFAVYRSGQSVALNNLIEILWLQISPYFNLLRESGNYTSANQHHRRIVQALSKGDAESARAGIVGDIEDAYSVLSKVLS